jgi:hypothetical protein
MVDVFFVLIHVNMLMRVLLLLQREEIEYTMIFVMYLHGALIGCATIPRGRDGGQRPTVS